MPRSVDDTDSRGARPHHHAVPAPDRNDRYETTADLEAELTKLDDGPLPIPCNRRLTWRTMAAADPDAEPHGRHLLDHSATAPEAAPPPTPCWSRNFVDKTDTPVFKARSRAPSSRAWRRCVHHRVLENRRPAIAENR